MTTTTFPDRASARSSGRAVALDRAVAAQAARRRADVELLDAALGWAHAHTVDSEIDAARWEGEGHHLFGERRLAIAGAGTPLVGEFAVVELSGALGISHEAALSLVGDALDLHHRLPLLWALVRQLRVPAHLAREAAQASRDLDVAAVAHADRLLVWQPRRLNPHRIGMLVHEARLYADPDRASADHDAALAARAVDVDHQRGAPGTSEVHMVLDTADALAFDDTVTTLADTMKQLGHPGTLDARRATSVGVLADPQRALDLLSANEVPAGEWDASGVISVAEDACFKPPTPFVAGGEVTLVLHLTDRDLLTAGPLATGAVVAGDALGPLAVRRLSSWLMGATKVVIKPVLEPTNLQPVDRHDPPARLAEAVRLRDATCVFPGCTRSSVRADLDHITPYEPLDEGGPRGQTSYENLAPLCRRHQRAKTHGAFDYCRGPDGSYQWRLPAGAIVATEPRGPRPRPPT